MKKLSFAFLLFVLWVSFANAAGSRGNGNTVTVEKDVLPFESIYAGGKLTVNYFQSQEYRVFVTIDSNLEEYLNIFTENNRLNIRTKRGKKISPREFTVDVYSPGLSDVSMSGDIQFRGTDIIHARDFSLRISGSGDVDASIICESFSARSSGSSLITLAGSCNDLSISISGSGNFNAYEFQANTADVRVSGSSRIDLWVLEHLRAKMSGSGWLRYRGNPFVDLQSSGSGYFSRG